MNINIGIGFSQASTSQAAGIEAVKQALTSVNSPETNFMLVFADSRYDQNNLMQGIKQATNTPFIGCSSIGVYNNSNFLTSHGVLVIVFSSETVSFSAEIVQNSNQNILKSGEQLAQLVTKKNPQPKLSKSLLIFSNNTPGNQNLLVQGAQNILGEDFEIVGGISSNNEEVVNTYQYFNGQTYQNSVVGVLISGDILTSSAIGTAWESVGNRVQVTKSKDNIIYELDNKPALEVYKLYLGPERAAKLPDIAYQYPFAILPPPGSPQNQDPSAYLHMRTPYIIDENQQSLIFNGEIPENCHLTLTAASRQNLIQQASKTTQLAKESLSGAKPLLILNITNYGRTLVLGRRTQEEIKTIQETINTDIPVVGFFSSGEFGPYDKAHPEHKHSKFQNQCNAIWILGTNVFQI